MNIKQLVDYNSVFGSHETNFSNLPWDKLNEVRSRIDEGSEKLTEKVMKEQRDFTAEESNALKQATEFLTSLRDEKDRRLANGSQNPIQDTPARSIDFGTNRAFPQSDDARDTMNSGAGVGKTYRQLFHDNKSGPLDSGGFKSFREFVQIIHDGTHDPRMEKRMHLEGIGAVGGNILADQHSEQVWTPVLEDSFFMRLAYIKPVLYGSSYYQPVLKNYSHVGGIFGVTPVWTAEGATGTDQDLTFGYVQLSVYKLLLYMSASNELISDGVGVEKQLFDACRSALIWSVETECLTGNGVAKPTGILNAASKVTVSRNTAGDVKYADIASMFARLYPGCVANSVWIVSVSALPRLVQMADAANNLIWQPNAVGSTPGSIFGRPVYLTEKTPALGSEGDVILTDLSQYCIAMRKEITLDKSSGPGFYSDSMAYRAGIRMNGMPLWESAITPANGSDDLSWCVVLD